METKAVQLGNSSTPNQVFKPFIFVSYAHEDSRWFGKGSLMPRLIRSLERRNVEVWFDKGRIGGADIWRDEIENAIDRADIAILLVSQFFLNSDFIMRIELPRLAKRAEAKQLVIFPILVGYCEWEAIETISRPQMMPGEPTPLVEYLEPEARWEKVQYEILQALLRQIGKIRKEREKPKAQAGLKGGANLTHKPVMPEPENVDIPPSPSGERSGWFSRIGNLMGLERKKASALAAAEVTLSKDGSKSAGQGSIPTETTARTQQIGDEPYEVAGGSVGSAKTQPFAGQPFTADSHNGKPEQKNIALIPSGKPDLSTETVVPVARQEATNNENPPKDEFAFVESEWGAGTDVDLKLIGTSSKEHRLSKKKSGDPMNLNISGSLAFLPTYEGLRAFDISNPRSPKFLSFFTAPYVSKKWFEFIGEIGLLRGSDASIKVIGYRDPANPKEVVFDNYHRNIFDNCGNGLLVYNRNIVIDLCHSETSGVKVFDFSDQMEINKNVRKIGVIHFSAGSGTLLDDYLLLGSYINPQLHIARVSKTEVKEIRTLTIETSDGCLLPMGMAAGNGRLYVFGKGLSSSRPQLAVYNLRNFPEELEFESCCELPREHVIRTLFGVQVYISGDWLYYCDRGRLFVYDLSQPIHPKLGFVKDGPFYVAHISGNMMYCGDDRNIWIFEIVRKRQGTSACSESGAAKQPSPENETTKENLTDQSSSILQSVTELPEPLPIINQPIFLYSSQCLIIDRQSKKEVGPRYILGSVFEYLRKDEDDYGWYLLKEDNTIAMWIRQGHITLEDKRTFFQIEGRSIFGYLVSNLYDDLSGGQLEKIVFDDLELGTIELYINSIAKITVGSAASEPTIISLATDGNTYSGKIKEQVGSYRGGRTSTFLVCPDALIRIGNEKDISLVRADKKDLEFPTEEIITDTRQRRLKIAGRSNTGYIEDPLNYFNYFTFSDIVLGKIQLKISRIKRIQVDAGEKGSPIIIETYGKNIFTGTTEASVECESLTIKLNAMKKIILEAV